MILTTWAQRWGIPAAAVHDLQQQLGMVPEPHPAPAPPRSEAAVQAAVRVAASRQGMRVWRNNVGAVHDPERGLNIRFGLANDSPQINAVIKSADLIGIAPRIVQPGDVGRLIGQFVSFECKHEGWRPRPNDEREQAQARWAALVVSLGGIARFCSHERDV